MKLLQLTVTNFRNFKEIHFEPAGGVNLFWGANAQGKTNLLEAVYYLVTGRSFRTHLDREVLPWNCAEDTVATIRGTVETPESEYQIVVAVNRNRKQVSCNGKALSSLGLLWGKMNAVLFTPYDLDIVQGPPATRRRFMDMEGSQIDQSYLYQLQKYNQILRQRNALLKSDVEEEALSESLEVWDEQIASPAAEIFCFRRNFLAHLSAASQKIYNNLAGSGEYLDLSYDNFLGKDDPLMTKDIVEAFYRKDLKRSRSEDLYKGSTSCGPHRDDFRILVNGQDARSFASQGQQRSIAIALRLAEIGLMQEYTGHTPLLLLDDLVSELDEGRRDHFLSLLDPRYQTFITGTDADTLRGSLPVEKTFHIHEGSIV